MTLDEFILMPNHIHGIVVIKAPVGFQHAGPLPPQPWSPPGSIGTIVRSFKSAVTTAVNEQQLTIGMPVWHRNYHERVVRDGEEMNRIRQYILENPLNWGMDAENPSAT